MNTKTSIFCQIMPEKNEVKDANPLKKEKITPTFVQFKHINSFASKTV